MFNMFNHVLQNISWWAGGSDGYNLFPSIPKLNMPAYVKLIKTALYSSSIQI